MVQTPLYVFSTTDNKQLTDNGIKLIFKRFQKKMNFKDCRLSAHTFRHTLAFRFLRDGGDNHQPATSIAAQYTGYDQAVSVSLWACPSRDQRAA
ncbi:Phage integrase family protein [compost metagenome]